MAAPFKVEITANPASRLRQLVAVESAPHSRPDRRVFFSRQYSVWITFEPSSQRLSFFKGCPCGD